MKWDGLRREGFMPRSSCWKIADSKSRLGTGENTFGHVREDSFQFHLVLNGTSAKCFLIQ